MTNYWCVNFDLEPVLRHGLAQDMWMMQYQYSHDGFDYQGVKAISATSRHWRLMQEVKAGDWLVAYFRESTFYAIGWIIPRRTRERHASAVIHTDSTDRVIREQKHVFWDGVVGFTDAPVLYEDFSDSWSCPATPEPGQPNQWKYNQRIDVDRWEFVVPAGVQVPGLAKAAPFPLFRQSIFPIPETYFNNIRSALRRASQR